MCDTPVFQPLWDFSIVSLRSCLHDLPLGPLLGTLVQIMPTLVAGGTLVVAKPGGHMDASYIASLIVQHHVTSMIFTVPTLVSTLGEDACTVLQWGRVQNLLPDPHSNRTHHHPTQANEFMRAPELPTPYHAMRSWSTGGETVSLDTILRMQEVRLSGIPVLLAFAGFDLTCSYSALQTLPASQLVPPDQTVLRSSAPLSALQVFPNISAMSVYGPTEVTAVTVHHPYGPKPDHIVIGRPDSNTHAYIVDSNMRLVPVGVPGELLLSGPRLAIGAPAALTHSAFLRSLPRFALT